MPDHKLGGDLAATEASPSPSAARLAAEALFAPSTAVEAAGVDVTVKVRWVTDVTAQPVTPDPDIDQVRAPRVFRVDHLALTNAPGDFTSEVGAPEAETAPTGAPAPAARTRRKRRQLHGAVSIIRPEADPAVNQITAHAAAEEVATDWPLYPKLCEQIRALETEAAVVLQREKALALAWIRESVDVHGLTPRDLGLR